MSTQAADFGEYRLGTVQLPQYVSNHPLPPKSPQLPAGPCPHYLEDSISLLTVTSAHYSLSPQVARGIFSKPREDGIFPSLNILQWLPHYGLQGL